MLVAQRRDSGTKGHVIHDGAIAAGVAYITATVTIPHFAVAGRQRNIGRAWSSGRCPASKLCFESHVWQSLRKLPLSFLHGIEQKGSHTIAAAGASSAAKSIPFIC